LGCPLLLVTAESRALAQYHPSMPNYSCCNPATFYQTATI
jgi:hypothetical protein